MKLIPAIPLLLLIQCASASVFYLPDNGDNTVGQLQQVIIGQGQTLIDIARSYNLGYNEITAANPGVDPWLPDTGSSIVIPSRFTLPAKPWSGIAVNLAEMRLFYFPATSDRSGRKLVYTFPLGIGQRSSPTPHGNYKVTDIIQHPVWTVPESILAEAAREGVQMPRQIPPGDNNPLGEYAIVLDEPGYLIHGTNRPLSIGRRVSHGCLRLYPEDIEQLATKVQRGDSVRIIEH